MKKENKIIIFIKKIFNIRFWNSPILITSLLIGLFLLGFTAKNTYKYFSKNELLNNISEKYNTTEKKDIKETIDTISIKQNQSNKINLKKNDSQYDAIIKKKESFELGDIGDFLGGYFGILIGFIGITFTFIAFWVQYMANIQVQDQFKLQQFENQFQKMIDVYLNNKDKFSIIGYKNPKNSPVILTQDTTKNINDKISEILQTKESAQSQVERPFIDYLTKDQIIFQKFVVELKVIDRVFREAYKQKNNILEANLSDDLKKDIFIVSYHTFFKGLNKYSKEYKENQAITSIDEDSMLSGFKILKNLRRIYKIDGTKEYENFYQNENGDWKTLWLKVNYEPFKGYMHFLPQYYRNLFAIVKFVVNTDLNLNDDDKLKYLRILRSTISDYEQVMLFYNWYSKIGQNWEDDNNKFFTEFKMIHNIKKILLIDDDIRIFNILKVPQEKQQGFFENY
ncbi:putative phage abortive infection protein [uncultured Chryseobacterium sp.]|uniref:putative phage abortive infection protein n=1 Tax=uncultured Chryseobacterium sp. TaxID=259322 RepID=UPI0025DA11CB|nr:putative phage abortive infection protein [uncultured Chryseobacterium sp.]